MARLGAVTLMTRDLLRSKAFYEGLGLVAAAHVEDAMVVFDSGVPEVPIILKTADLGSATAAIGGSTPLLVLAVEDLDAGMAAAMTAGAAMDGAVQYEDGMRVAVLRTPDEHMVTLMEGAPAGAR